MRCLIAATVATVLVIVGVTPAAANATGWKQLPVLPVISGSVRDSFTKDLERGNRRGMRAKVFAKLGDSNTEMVSALYGLGCREARLGGRSRLKAVISRYNRVKLPNARAMADCSPSTSFSRRSAAASSGTPSAWSLIRVADLPTTGYWAAPADCAPEETPVSCEIRLTRPRYVFIMTGTNDVGLDRYLGFTPGSRTVYRMGRLVAEIRRLGSVPVLSTLPPLLTAEAGPAAIDPYNAAIAKAARRNRVPLINLWRALNAPSMIGSGMDEEGFHLRTLAGGTSPLLVPTETTYQDSVDFSREGLRIGSNRRNLIWLQTLARLDRAAGFRAGR